MSKLTVILTLLLSFIILYGFGVSWWIIGLDFGLLVIFAGLVKWVIKG